MRALVATAVLAGALTFTAPASAETISLTPEETEALKVGLISSKPSLSTVTIASFLFPGTMQAYMGHPDRTLIMWGCYLGVFAGAKSLLPDDNVVGGIRTSDAIVAGTFMAMAAYSAVDAFLLAREKRDEFDRLINRLSDRQNPEVKGTESVPKP